MNTMIMLQRLGLSTEPEVTYLVELLTLPVPLHTQKLDPCVLEVVDKPLLECLRKKVARAIVDKTRYSFT